MNRELIGRYLQRRRIERGYTQEGLAKRLNLSRQAVSKWETGENIPDLDVLLRLSRLYNVTVNELVEPEVEKVLLKDFEDIMEISGELIKEVILEKRLPVLVKASMGASPAVNAWLVEVFPQLNLVNEQNRMGRIRLEDVEDAQREIVDLLNAFL